MVMLSMPLIQFSQIILLKVVIHSDLGNIIIPPDSIFTDNFIECSDSFRCFNAYLVL